LKPLPSCGLPINVSIAKLVPPLPPPPPTL
jgi:hypothetical protein